MRCRSNLARALLICCACCATAAKIGQAMSAVTELHAGTERFRLWKDRGRHIFVLMVRDTGHMVRAVSCNACHAQKGLLLQMPLPGALFAAVHRQCNLGSELCSWVGQLF
jgi:hypothetical protein